MRVIESGDAARVSAWARTWRRLLQPAPAPQPAPVFPTWFENAPRAPKPFRIRRPRPRPTPDRVA